MNQSEQMNEALGTESTDEAKVTFMKIKDLVVKTGSLSGVINSLAVMSRQGVEFPREGGGGIIQHYGKAVPDALQRAADQAHRMEKRG